MNDEELTRRLHAAFPKASARDVSAHQAGIRDEIAAGTYRDASPVALRPAPRPRFVTLPIAASVGVAFIIALALITVVLRPPVAMAATPPVLEARPVSGTAQQLLTEIAASVRQQGEPASDSIRYQQWRLAFDAESEEPPQQMTPEIVATTFAADGSWHSEARAGETSDANGERVANPEYAAGELLWTLEVEAEDFAPVFSEAPPTNTDEVGPYLRTSGYVVDETAGEYFEAVQAVLLEHSVSSAQSAALIEYLTTLPGITVAGEVTDRLGRSGIAFTAPSSIPGGYEHTVVINGTQGILSYEFVYTGSDRTDVQAPAVLAYIAWE